MRVRLFILVAALVVSPFSLSTQPPPNGWPTGRDGALVIRAGETASVQAGAVLDYASIDIQHGGTLEILQGAAWTLIGVTGDMRLKGTIVVRPGNFGPQTISLVAPDGRQLDHTIDQAPGGAGGGLAACHPIAGGGAPQHGNGGGGGAAGNAGRDATATAGGMGANGNYEVNGTGGAGGVLYARDGAAGGDVSQGGDHIRLAAGGGGGGSRGLHSSPLYIRVAGSFDGPGGLIEVSGTAGGAGGRGGAATPSSRAHAHGGGGGGGGAGGSGGTVRISYRGGYAPAQVRLMGGKGGEGGPGGSARSQPANTCSWPNWAGVTGAPGSDGRDGRLTTSKDP